MHRTVRDLRVKIGAGRFLSNFEPNYADLSVVNILTDAYFSQDHEPPGAVGA